MRDPRESFVKSITVQPADCEDFLLVPVRFLQSLRVEIDRLRADLGLPARQWEPSSDVTDEPKE